MPSLIGGTCLRIRPVTSALVLACMWTTAQASSSQWNENSSRRPPNTNTAATATARGSFEYPSDRRPSVSPADERRLPPGHGTADANRQPPPPPLPPPTSRNRYPPFESSPGAAAAASKNPIHYQFRSRSPLANPAFPNNRRGPRSSADEQDEADSVPLTFAPQPFRKNDNDYDEDNSDNDKSSRSGSNSKSNSSNPRFASARRDPIVRYTSSAQGRILLTLSSGTVGAAVGGFVGKSLLDTPYAFAATFGVLFVLLCSLRNPYAELAKALGLALIYALKRTRRIRRRYPTYGKIKAAIGAAQRQPFPPAENPWAYQPSSSSDDMDNINDNDTNFSMMYCTIAMGFVGSLCGGNLPLIPTWMGALSGAGGLAFLTTTRDARGDLCRTMGMRVVSLGQEMVGINSELELLRKLGVVSGKVFDKLMILDRKHRIKDRLVTGFSWAYDQVSRTASQVQNDMQSGPDEPPPVSNTGTGIDSRRGDPNGRGPDRREPDRRELDRREPDRREPDRRRGPPPAEPPRNSYRR